MVENYLRQSALAPLGLNARGAMDVDGKTGIHMGEKPFHGMIGIRVDAGDPEIMAVVEKTIGFALPAVRRPRCGWGRMNG